MARDLPCHPRNHWRRSLGVIIGLSPFALLVISLVYGSSRDRTVESGPGMVCMIVAALFGLLNAYLSWLRPVFHWLRCRSMDGYRHVSGIPVVGTVFVVAGGLLGF